MVDDHYGDVERAAGSATGPDYGDFHAVVADAIRHQARDAEEAAEHVLLRLAVSPRPLLMIAEGSAQSQAYSAMAAAIRRVTAQEAAHAALDALRDLGHPIPPRMPDDPFPDPGLSG